MTALYKKQFVKISQWCNDWFSIEVKGIPKIVSPSSLMFEYATFQEILKHNNNGFLLKMFEPVTNTKRGKDGYLFTFKRRKFL